VNYLIGDAKQWRTNIPTYERVRYSSVYPGVDLSFYGKQGGSSTTSRSHPGRMCGRFGSAPQGVDSSNIAANGDLVLLVGKQEVRWKNSDLPGDKWYACTGFEQSTQLVGGQIRVRSRRLRYEPHSDHRPRVWFTPPTSAAARRGPIPSMAPIHRFRRQLCSRCGNRFGSGNAFCCRH